MKNIYLGVLVMITIMMGYQVSFANTPASVEPKEVSNSVNIDGVVNAKKPEKVNNDPKLNDLKTDKPVDSEKKIVKKIAANKGVVNAEQTKKDDVIQSKPVLLAQAAQTTTKERRTS